MVNQPLRGAAPTPASAMKRWTWLGRIASGAVIVASAVRAWQSQYFVDSEMTLLPWLMARGWVLYRDMVDQHPPLLPALLVPLAGAGDPGLPLRLLIVCLLCLTLVLTYTLAARLAGGVAAAGAILIAALWLPPFEATHLWYDTALAPVYLGVGLLLTLYIRSDARCHLWLALTLGLLLGLGMLVKQHAAIAALGVGIALCWANLHRVSHVRLGTRSLFSFGVGMALPLVIASALLAMQGGFEEAWYWIVAYNLSGEYAGAAMPPSTNEWPVLAALYAPIITFLLLWLTRLRGRLSVAMPGHGSAAWAPAACGVLIAATLPAWPRYGRFHLHAAIPLLAIIAGISVVFIVRQLRSLESTKISEVGVAGIAALLLGFHVWSGVAQWSQTWEFQRFMGQPMAPYSSSLPALRAWVDQYAPPQAPIFIYGLDPMLYRALEREPPRPWVPTLRWLLKGEVERRFWQGVGSTRPPLALLAAGTWQHASQLQLAPKQTPEAAGLAKLRRDYHEVIRFQVINYPKAPPIEVVGLLWNDDASR